MARRSRNFRNETHELHYDEIIARTDRAWLLQFGDNEDEDRVQVWLPWSQCRINVEACTITAPEWLIVEKELEDYIDDD